MNIFGIEFSSSHKKSSEVETSMSADGAIYYYNFKKEYSDAKLPKELPKLAKTKHKRPNGLPEEPCGGNTH